MRTRVLAGAAAIVMAALAAGCGDDSSGGASATTTGSATTAAGTSAAGTTSAGTTGAGTTAAGGGGQPQCEPVGDINTASSRLDYQLTEFKMTGPATVAAGKVGFNLTNTGRANHEFVIIKGDSYEALPKNANGTIETSQLPAGAMVGEVEPFPGGGATCSGVFDLAPAKYVLLCNIEFQNGPQTVSHAGRGMVESFEVTA